MGLCCVQMEIRRIQGFLFQEPYLASMVGSNVLIGEFLRLELPALHGMFWRGQVPPEFAASKVVRPVVAGDPLAQSEDDPNASYAKGILVKDAGRFWALLNQDDVTEFIRQAESSESGLLLKGHLSWRVVDLDESSSGFGNVVHRLTPRPDGARLPSSLPFLAQDRQGNAVIFGEVDTPQPGVRQRKRDRFRANAAQDIASLLVASMDSRPAASDLETLAGGDYLAVVQLDGNGIGARLTELMGGEQPAPTTLSGWFQRQAHAESFFWMMRCLMRAATAGACRQVFGATNQPDQQSAAPYQLLMLGGDDLLLVCRAKQALDFVTAFSRTLKRCSQEAFDIDRSAAQNSLATNSPLSVSVGVVIARHSVPFAKLQHAASQLCASAKVPARSMNGPAASSVVDWAVTTQAWVDDPLAARRIHDCVDLGDSIHLLTRRPYAVDSSDALIGLDRLLEAARHLSSLLPDPARDERASRIARSQLKGLREKLASRDGLSLLAWLETPPALRKTIADLGIGVTRSSPWCTLPSLTGVPMLQATRLLDLIEIMEIETLGQQPVRGA